MPATKSIPRGFWETAQDAMSSWGRTALSKIGRGGSRGGGPSTRTTSGASDAYIAVVAYLLPVASSAAAQPRVESDPPRSAVVFDGAHGQTEAETRAYEDWYEQLQGVRRQWDDAFPRWSPHITLIPPFVVPKDPPNQLDAIAGKIRTVCERKSSFRLALDDCGRFKLRAYSNIHLRPSSAQTRTQGKDTNDYASEARGRSELVILQEELQATLPEASTNQRGKGDGGGRGQQRGRGGSAQGAPGRQGQQRQPRSFNPHVSLGQARNREEIDELTDAARRLSSGPLGGDSVEGVTEDGPKPKIELPVQEVVLLYFPQSQGAPYSIWQRFVLSGLPTMP